MLAHHDPDDWVVVIESHTCEHHKRQPWDVGWPGCTCGGSYGMRRATPEEREENIRKRKAEEQRRREHIDAYDRGEIK